MNQKEKIRHCRTAARDGSGRMVITVFCLICLALSGCTLAKPELQQTQAKEDRLCGVLVVAGEQEAERHYREEQENKTFSTMEELEKSLTSPVIAEGSRQPDRSYAFEGVEGHMLGIVEEQEGGESCLRFVNDGFFADVKANTKETDEGRENSISGTVLVPRSLKEPVYMYPVYGRADGSCYAVLDGGGFLMGGVSTEGEVYAQTFRWETSEEINGRKETDSTEIQVSLKMAVPVERACVRMYNDKDELLDIRKLSRGTKEVTLPEETAYVIVEEETADGRRKRSLYNWDEEQESMLHQINYPGNENWIAPTDLTLEK